MKTRSLYGKSGSNNNNSNNNNNDNDNDNSSDDNSNGSYGNAILSRYPITKSWTLSYTQWRWRPPRKCLFVEVDIVDNVDSVDRRCDRRRLCFGSTHLQNDMAGLESGEQLVEVRNREKREKRKERRDIHTVCCVLCCCMLCCCVLCCCVLCC